MKCSMEEPPGQLNRLTICSRILKTKNCNLIRNPNDQRKQKIF